MDTCNYAQIFRCRPRLSAPLGSKPIIARSLSRASRISSNFIQTAKPLKIQRLSAVALRVAAAHGGKVITFPARRPRRFAPPPKTILTGPNCNKLEAYRAADTQDRPIASRRRPCHARHSTPTNGPAINKS
jgi:hypothetical protein